jgi:hypothetical protein
MLREEDGFGTVNRSVKGWLEEATAAGSGDDCTLAIVCRMDALTASPSSSDTTSAASTASTQSTASTDSSPDAHAKPTPDASHEQPAAPKTA